MGTIRPINPTTAEIIANPQAALNYNSLIGKPSVKGVTLEGDMASSDIGLQGEITTSGFLTLDSGELSLYDKLFMVKRDALPKELIRDADKSGFTTVSESDANNYSTGITGEIPVAVPGTFLRFYSGDVCTEMYQTFDWKLYVKAYKIVGQYWLANGWKEIGGYTLTEQDKRDIAEIVLQNMQSTEEVT